MSSDYDNWVEAGNPGWSYNEVLPVFKRFEDNLEIGSVVDSDYHGTGGPLTTTRFNHQPELAYDILNSAQEIGYNISNDLNGKYYSGFTIAQSNTRNGVRLSAAKAYIRPGRNRQNLHVMLNSTATKIGIRQEMGKKIVDSVTFLYRNKLYTVKVKKEVVLAAGAINSPQILLLSGIGPKEALNKVGIKQIHNLPGVGKNLRNHVTFYMTYLLRKYKDTTELDWATALDYLLNKRGPMSSTGMSQVTARINSPYSDRSGTDPDLQIFFSGFLAKCAYSGEVKAASDPNHIDTPKSLVVSPVTLHPRSSGYIDLKTKNPLDAPRMVANYLTAIEDANTLVAGIRIIQKLLNSTVMRTKYGTELEKEEYGKCANIYGYNTDDFWKCAVHYYTGPENHQCCSNKMGPKSDKMSVVDNQLMVHGIDGIRITDASAMPIIVSGNTHATIVMMAERGVDFIKKRWLTTSLNNRIGSEDLSGINSNSYVVTPAVMFKPSYHYTGNSQNGPFQHMHSEHYNKFKPYEQNKQYHYYQHSSISPPISYTN